MRRLLRQVTLPALLALSLGSCDNAGLYNNNDLVLLTAYAAKEICSCVFVMGREDDFCAAWAEASPDLKTYQIDHTNKTVTAQAVLFWGQTARYVSFRRGCVLE
jgi:hypothetical protein